MMFRLVGRVKRLGLTLACSGALVTLFAGPVGAQQRQPVRTASNDRGQFVDGLVRDLINSQINFHAAPLEPLPSANLNVELQRARTELQRFSQAADRV